MNRAPATFQNSPYCEFSEHAQMLFTSRNAGRLPDSGVTRQDALDRLTGRRSHCRTRRRSPLRSRPACLLLLAGQRPALLWRSSTGHVFGLDHRPSDWRSLASVLLFGCTASLNERIVIIVIGCRRSRNGSAEDRNISADSALTSL